MRKLLLVSLRLGYVLDFVGAEPDKKKLAFIPTAADPYKDASFINRDRLALMKMGFDLRDVDIKGKSSQELEAELHDVDVVFVAGGNSFYLLDQARRSGFDQLLKRLLSRGVLYIGASAGAVLVGPDLRPIAAFDDPSYAPELDNMCGFGFVDFVVLPHYGVEAYLSEHEAVIARYSSEFKLIPLRNDQAVLVIDGNDEIVASQ